MRDKVAALQGDTLALWFCLRDPRTPLAAKLLGALVVAYALSPIDLVPDFIPLLGFLDDLVLDDWAAANPKRRRPKQTDAGSDEVRSKPIALTALMTLFDQQRFQLDDPVSRYLPEFREEGREQATLRHLLTHMSGLPDQLPNNNQLRAAHARLSEFTAAALRVPLSFPPGSRYQYSSMGILLAAEIAQRLSGRDIRTLVQQTVFGPLSMHNSALGTGQLLPEQIMACQTDFAAPEAGAGAADAKSWDWNSPFWRQLGAPWGGVHASAADVGRWLSDFLQPSGRVLRSETTALMIRNHNPPDMESRGLAFDVGMDAVCRGCSPRTFGHTGSTGTIALADPDSRTICVVLTTLPGPAVSGTRHPRLLAAEAALQRLR